MADILEQVKQVFARVMEVDPSQVGPATSPDNLEQWDSVAHVQLVMGLEEQFNLTISPEESIEFENVQNIVDWLEKNLG